MNVDSLIHHFVIVASGTAFISIHFLANRTVSPDGAQATLAVNDVSRRLFITRSREKADCVVIKQ